MSRRLEIELTSERPDGTWTWRKAGAREPKGEMIATVLPPGSKVGDVLRAEADFLLDGIEILSIVPPKSARKEPELLKVLGSGRSEPGVTTQLVEKKDRGDRRERRDRGDRGERRGDRRDARRDGGAGSGGDRRPRGPRPDPVPERPKPKRLRPGRAHRTAVLEEVAPEMRPIAEQVLKGGVPAVREAVAEQNKQAKAENRPEAPVDQVVALAEAMLPALRTAEWRDRAEAALADLDELDLRDLRSVVVAADNVTRDDEVKALREQLQAGLNRRVEEEHKIWVSDIEANLGAGRFVRALRLTSRPPKAGTPVPAELGEQLVAAVSAGLTPTTNQELWAAAVDALAYSPVRGQVIPVGIPEKPTDDLLEAVRRVADRVPKVAALFGVDPAEAAAAKRRSRPGRTRGAARKGSEQRTDSAKPAAAKADRSSAKESEKSEKSDAGSATEQAGDDVAAEVPSAAAEPTAPEAASTDATTSDAPIEADAPVEAETKAETEAEGAGAEVAAEVASAEVDGSEPTTSEPVAETDEAVTVDAGSPEAFEVAADETEAHAAPVEEPADAVVDAGAQTTETDDAEDVPSPAVPDESPTAIAMDLDDAVSDNIEGDSAE